MEECTGPDCSRPAYSRSLCKAHTNHLYRYGEARRFRLLPSPILRFRRHAEIVLYDVHLREIKHRVWIDLTDIPLVSGKRFYLDGHGYAKLATSSRHLYLHQLLLPAPHPLVTDHINRNKLDCRRKNLRIVTRSENNYNKGPAEPFEKEKPRN
jgi:hypothetical protein